MSANLVAAQQFLAEGHSSAGGTVLSFVLLGLYFVPTFLAVLWSVPRMARVIVVNVFLGFTVIGWFVALALVLRARPKHGSAHGDSVPQNTTGGHHA
jgi:hypothetical protein